MSQRPKWFLLGPVSGMLALLAPLCGWAGMFAFPGEAPGAVLFFGGGIVAVGSCLASLIVGTIALTKSGEFEGAKRLGVASLMLGLVAILSWCLEWGFLLTHVRI